MVSILLPAPVYDVGELAEVGHSIGATFWAPGRHSRGVVPSAGRERARFVEDLGDRGLLEGVWIGCDPVDRSVANRNRALIDGHAVALCVGDRYSALEAAAIARQVDEMRAIRTVRALGLWCGSSFDPPPVDLEVIPLVDFLLINVDDDDRKTWPARVAAWERLGALEVVPVFWPRPRDPRRLRDDLRALPRSRIAVWSMAELDGGNLEILRGRPVVVDLRPAILSGIGMVAWGLGYAAQLLGRRLARASGLHRGRRA
ncbi:MAG: hypothetical protein R3B09_32330 [Nannocystaceae bacterium]